MGGSRVTGSVALVLGAGNQTAVACMDILHKLLVDDAVVVCKMNPVNEYLGQYLRCRWGKATAKPYILTLNSRVVGTMRWSCAR